MRHLINRVIIPAMMVVLGSSASAQTPATLSPFQEGMERREAGVFFCHKMTIASELAELLNQNMLAQRQSINGETLHVFGKDHPTMRLMSSRMANGECEVINYESTFTPQSLAFDGRFKDGEDTVNGMNVIEAKLVKADETITIFILTDAAFEKKTTP